MKTILSLCDFSGRWPHYYERSGYEVVRIDLRFGDDVRTLPFRPNIHGILAAPPCTHLAGSGARWWKGKGQPALLDALALCDACLRFVALCRPAWWCLENPVGRLSRFYGKPQMTFNPCEYAGWLNAPEEEAYTKRTCLWGSFTHPERRAVEPTQGSALHRLPPTEDRADKRSLTPLGFARAFFLANP